MKILYITNGIAGSGGLERVLSIKASKLVEDFNHEVHILALNESPETDTFFKFSPNIIRHEFQAKGNALRYIYTYRKELNNKIKEIKPDVISVCDDGLKGFLVPKLIGNKIPIIYERHVSKQIEKNNNQSSIQKLKTNLSFKLMNYLAKNFTRFVVLTEGNTTEWNLPNLTVISNPLPFEPTKKSTLKNKKIIAVGKQSHQKAYDRLLKVWSKLNPEFSDWELHIYGKQDESLGLKKLRNKLNLENNVYFHNPVKNIESKYLDSSVFVLSSRFEGFGMVLIEAMAHGLPVVSFDCPHGPKDIIANGTDGFLIPNGNIDTFTIQLEKLMQNQDLRTEMGENALNSIERYKPNNILNQWNSLFTEISH